MHLSEHWRDYLDPVDIQFAALLRRLGGPGTPESVCLAGALVSRASADGDVCVDLARGLSGTEELTLSVPESRQWAAELRDSPLVGDPGDYTPLVLDGDCLYLHRYWDYEQRLAQQLHQRGGTAYGEFDDGLARSVIASLFPAQTENVTDWQSIAAAIALLRLLESMQFRIL